MKLKRIKEFLLDLFFPKFCFGCGREGSYLCQDCKETLEILKESFCLCEKPQRLHQVGKCLDCKRKKLDGLYFAVFYRNPLIKELIKKFKYSPFGKELKSELSQIILDHFSLLKKGKEDFKNFIIVPIPLSKKREAWRGFNQAKEIALELSEKLEVPLLENVLFKEKERKPQVELKKEERKENIKGVFKVKNSSLIFKRNILLIDDVYTSGATLEEGAKVLKEAGAKKVFGVVIARDVEI